MKGRGRKRNKSPFGYLYYILNYQMAIFNQTLKRNGRV